MTSSKTEKRKDLIFIPDIAGTVVFFLAAFSMIGTIIVTILTYVSVWLGTLTSVALLVCIVITSQCLVPIRIDDKKIRRHKKSYKWDEVYITAIQSRNAPISPVYGLLFFDKYCNSTQEERVYCKQGIFVPIQSRGFLRCVLSHYDKPIQILNNFEGISDFVYPKKLRTKRKVVKRLIEEHNSKFD